MKTVCCYPMKLQPWLMQPGRSSGLQTTSILVIAPTEGKVPIEWDKLNISYSGSLHRTTLDQRMDRKWFLSEEDDDPWNPGAGQRCKLKVHWCHLTPAPGGDAVDARLATLMPLTPAPKRDVGGSVHRSEVYGRRLYLVNKVIGLYFGQKRIFY